MRGSEALTAGAFAVAWQVLRHAPETWAYPAGDRLADALARRGGRGPQRLRANLARALAEPGGPPVPPERLDATVRAGLRSYVRYWVDAFRLPSWDTERVVGTVRTEGVEPVQSALASGRGAVAALAHLGNWDHAGAWSALALAPVTTVAERLRPEALYRRFVAYREALGIEVLPLTGGESPVAVLQERLRAGRFVCLLADRDLRGRGTRVDLLGEPARVAAGPAWLAAGTGAALYPVTCHYERSGASPSGWGLVVVFHPEVPVPGRDAASLRGAVQACADAWSTAIRAHPEDWHMLQPVFAADLAAPAAGPPGAA